MAAGQVGRAAGPRGPGLSVRDEYPRPTGRGRSSSRDIILKTGADGRSRLSEGRGADLNWGPKNQDYEVTLDGKPAVGLAIYRLPASNSLDPADQIKAQMRKLERRFPKGQVRHCVRYDALRPGIGERGIPHAARCSHPGCHRGAAVLQDWKSLLLPVVDVAVSLVGTFAVMKLMGFSLNNLTLFGLVLAIGIVVDDAIVVLENIERWLDKGLPVRDATIKAMDEIRGRSWPSRWYSVPCCCPVRSWRHHRSVFSPVCLDYLRLDASLGNQCHDHDAAGPPGFLPSGSPAVMATTERRPCLGGSSPSWAVWAACGCCCPPWGPRLGLPTGVEGEAPGGLKDSLLAFGVHVLLFLPGVVAGGLLGLHGNRSGQLVPGPSLPGFRLVP